MIRWSKRARGDLVCIGLYTARDKPVAARRWTERLHAHAELAAEMPLAGRVVPSFGRNDIREVFLRSYRIVYRVTGYGIFVLTVFDGHKRMQDIDPDTED